MRINTTRWLSGGAELASEALGFALVLTALSATALATRAQHPEIDPGLATSAMALLSGGLLIIAARRHRH